MKKLKVVLVLAVVVLNVLSWQVTKHRFTCVASAEKESPLLSAGCVPDDVTAFVFWFVKMQWLL